MRRIIATAIVPLLSLTLAGAQGNSTCERLERCNRAAARGEYQEARLEFQDAPDASCDWRAVFLYNTGVCYYHSAKTQEAAAEYREAIQSRGGRSQKASYVLGVAPALAAAFVQTATGVAAHLEV